MPSQFSLRNSFWTPSIKEPPTSSVVKGLDKETSVGCSVYGTDVVLGSLVVGLMALLSFVLKMTRPSAEQNSVFAGWITDVASCARSDSKEGSTGKGSGSCMGATEDVDLSVEVLAAFVSARKKMQLLV